MVDKQASSVLLWNVQRVLVFEIIYFFNQLHESSPLIISIWPLDGWAQPTLVLRLMSVSECGIMGGVVFTKQPLQMQIYMTWLSLHMTWLNLHIISFHRRCNIGVLFALCLVTLADFVSHSLTFPVFPVLSNKQLVGNSLLPLFNYRFIWVWTLLETMQVYNSIKIYNTYSIFWHFNSETAHI